MENLMWRVIVSMVVLTLFAGTGLCAEDDSPWWKQGKINFMWGGWWASNHNAADAAIKPRWKRPVPRKAFRNAALAGATVFADLWQYSPAHARMAKKHGLRYFSCSHLHHMKWMKGRRYISEKGVEAHAPRGTAKYPFKCPFDEPLWERWLAKASVQDGIREGIVDGIHTDWEDQQAGVGVCYCDWCFAEFLKRQGIEAELPAKAERHAWLKARELDKVYADPEAFSQRRVEMLTRIREKLQAMNPRLMFSSYGTAFSDFTRAMHTPQVPYMFARKNQHVAMCLW